VEPDASRDAIEAERGPPQYVTYLPRPGNGPFFMNAFSTLAVTLDALLSQALMGRAWPQAMELADHTAPSFGVVK